MSEDLFGEGAGADVEDLSVRPDDVVDEELPAAGEPVAAASAARKRSRQSGDQSEADSAEPPAKRIKTEKADDPDDDYDPRPAFGAVKMEEEEDEPDRPSFGSKLESKSAAEPEPAQPVVSLRSVKGPKFDERQAKLMAAAGYKCENAPLLCSPLVCRGSGGLGRSGQGRVAPIEASNQVSTTGLGFSSEIKLYAWLLAGPSSSDCGIAAKTTCTSSPS